MSTRVLVTGAGSGLGKQIAARYLRAGARVLLTDVDSAAAEAAARELAGPGEASALVLDVTAERDFPAAREWCERTWGGLDVLVNNAGVAAGGRFERIEMADWDWIIDINLKGVVRGCRTFVPLFKRQRSGHLINIASLAAIMNLPAMASYNVTKSAVVSLSETLRHELRPYGIHTTVVCPAYFRTNLARRLRSPDPQVVRITEKFMASSNITAEQVADAIYTAAARGRFLVHTHPAGRRSALLKRFLPGVVAARTATYWDRLRPALDGPDDGTDEHGKAPA